MSHRTRLRVLGSIGVLVAVTVGAPVVTAAPPTQAICEARTNDNLKKLLECVTLEGVREHQASFQAIANANGGVRTSGTPGYDASADYVVERMTAAGYDVTTQDFQFQTFIALAP